jgi:hypothetical protein
LSTAGKHTPAPSIIGRMSKARRLGLVLLLNVLLVAALVIVGMVAHSLGVLAAGVDYLADAAAIAVSLVAIRLAQQPARRRPSSGLRLQAKAWQLIPDEAFVAHHDACWRRPACCFRCVPWAVIPSNDSPGRRSRRG